MIATQDHTGALSVNPSTGTHALITATPTGSTTQTTLAVLLV